MTALQNKLNRLPTEKKWLRNRIEQIKTAPDGAMRWLKDLGKNDFEHAMAVEEYVNKIIIESKVRISYEEAYLLIHAIYTHDIGYRVNSKNHPNYSYELIIKNPERYFIFDSQLSEAIALIGLAHGIKNINEIPEKFPIGILSKTKEFDLRYLGSLLLLGDEMDQGYLRVFNRMNQDQSPRKNVYHVEIGTQIIKLKTKPTTRSEWETLKKISSDIQDRLNLAKPVLMKNGINLELISLYPQVWAKLEGHDECSPKKITKSKKAFFLLLDDSALSFDIKNYVSGTGSWLTKLSVFNASLSQSPNLIDSGTSCIIWVLSEDFSTSITNEVFDQIIQAVSYGVGLLIFPFAAWSVSQGINDYIEEILPVNFSGSWVEGKKQDISVIKYHEINHNIKPFSIKNTYEFLNVKNGFESIIDDTEKNPFLIVGKYKKGKVAYCNISSHLCSTFDNMISPWQQDENIQRIIQNTINWLSTKESVPIK